MSTNLNNGNGRISSLSRLQNLLSRNRRNSFIIRNHSLNNINNINNINNSNQIPHDLSSILNLYQPSLPKIVFVNPSVLNVS